MGKLSEEEILRSIKELVLIKRSNSILIIFSKKIKWFDIEKFSRYFAVYFSRKGKEKFYLSMPLVDVSTRNNRHALEMNLSLPKKGSNITHILCKTDKVMFVHVATDKGMEFNFNP